VVTPGELLTAALRYAEMGYPVFPCAPGGKSPLTEHGFHDATVDSEQVERWWTQHPCANIGIPTEGLVVIDIDGEGNPWPGGDPERMFDLAAGPMALTPRGGSHRLFRQPHGKNWRCTEGRLASRVDTRADGGYIVAPPSVVEGGKAYRWAPGLELDDPPDRLPEPPPWLAQELDRLAPSANGTPTLAHVAAGPPEANAIPEGQRNATLAKLGGNMRRVGMSLAEIAAALIQTNKDRCVPPLSPREVERIAASVARYEPDQVAVALAENHWDQMYAAAAGEDAETTDSVQRDPGPVPEELLRVPGFVSELMDHCLATAPYPNVALAFGGALVLQALLAGRKARDPGDNRTNLYLLGLAHSSAGKDWPRKLNTEIAHQVGLADGIGERFASGEGIQDALFITPSMLFQTDEIDGLLQSINKARDGRHESIMSTLLTMYSSANSVYPMRRKAGRESPGSIDQPCLSVFGTAIPNHYYAALSERMLTNGLFARMLILESSRRGAGQEPVIRNIPARIFETAAWWANFQPGTGNLQAWHPVPVVVDHTDEARQILIEARRLAEAEYDRAEGRNDAVGTTVWGRVSEQTRKLALLHAVSANHAAPRIDQAASEWAVQLVMHQARRMLYMAGLHVSETEFDQRCKRVVELLTAWQAQHGDAWMPYRDLSRKLRWSRREHEEVREALIDQERIDTDVVTTTGRPKLVYRLRALGAGRSS
jgi:hypothetical protein